MMGYYSWIRKIDKRYEDTDNNPYTPGVFVGYDVYPGKGNGFAIIFKIYNTWKYGKFGISFTAGRMVCRVKGISNSGALDLSGIHLFGNWRIPKKGGTE